MVGEGSGLQSKMGPVWNSGMLGVEVSEVYLQRMKSNIQLQRTITVRQGLCGIY